MSELTIRPDGKFDLIFIDGERVGEIVKTTRPIHDMRWKWEACGHYGFASTREKALAAIDSLVPIWRRMKAKERAKDEAFAKLHPALQEALNREAKAKFEYERAFSSPTKSRDHVRDLQLAYLCAHEERLEVEGQLLEMEAA